MIFDSNIRDILSGNAYKVNMYDAEIWTCYESELFDLKTDSMSATDSA